MKRPAALSALLVLLATTNTSMAAVWWESGIGTKGTWWETGMIERLLALFGWS